MIFDICPGLTTEGCTNPICKKDHLTDQVVSMVLVSLSKRFNHDRRAAPTGQSQMSNVRQSTYGHSAQNFESYTQQ
jgi:hypothetical protein